MAMKVSTCSFCKEEFAFDTKKRKDPKFCNFGCYLTHLRASSSVSKPEIENQEERWWHMAEKEWAQNIALAIALVIALIIMWKSIF